LLSNVLEGIKNRGKGKEEMKRQDYEKKDKIRKFLSSILYKTEMILGFCLNIIPSVDEAQSER
jgi:hypothetical protein